jgi:hypothetical protein
VTKLGEFPPFERLFSLDSFFITDGAQIYGTKMTTLCLWYMIFLIEKLAHSIDTEENFSYLLDSKKM